MVRSVALASVLHPSAATISRFHFDFIAIPPLCTCRNHKVLRFFRSWIMNAVHFIGVNERRRSRPDQCCLALNAHSHVAFHEQKQFFVLVPVRWMRLASRGQGGFMYLEMLAS